jgi:hypothetical protein
MLVHRNVVRFQYLTTADTTVIGEKQAITAVIKSKDTVSGPNINDCSIIDEMNRYEAMGREAARNFNKMFSK